MQEIRWGTVACDIYVWAHELWWREQVDRLTARLAARKDPESREFATALARAVGQLAYVESEIEVERARARRTAPDPVPY
jgi:hypothetical protein